MNHTANVEVRAEGPWGDLAIHTMGWKAFQDLCSQVMQEVLGAPVQVYREAQDGGQDAVFTSSKDGEHVDATIQCKFSSDPRRRLKPGDLTGELESVRNLVAAGQADTYVLMTSMGVDAGVAVEIRTKLRAVGVRKPHVFGKEFLVRSIKGDPKLRALVPQVYGLGDLSLILDQRLIQQTRALLHQWMPKLNRYVATEAHRKAVEVLTEHDIVLLLGNPSSGKSTIGAILSTIALEDGDVTVVKLASPREFENAWAPFERKRFFWIDDAFGPNTLRDDFVQEWPNAFLKMQAAITQGNRFLLTSRRHIYEAAKGRLGQRNYPLFSDRRAIVDVGALSSEEKAQILYNHIAFGNQTQSWKRSVKSKLEDVAAVDNFLPGIAERLGDPNFTKGLGTSADELTRFMREPKEHLVDTINALEPPLRAGLMLVYVHRGALKSEDLNDDACAAVAQIMDVSLSTVQESLPQLLGSFLLRYSATWTFAHPTIADAITTILGERSHMIAALIRGAKIETILDGFVCERSDSVVDAPIIPSTLDALLVQRLIAAEDSLSTNQSIFSFLAYRASEDVLRAVIDADPSFLDRGNWGALRSTSDPKMRVYAHANSVGLLSQQQLAWAASTLEENAMSESDFSILNDESMLALIPPRRLVSLGFRLNAEVIPKLERSIETTLDNADLDEEPESQFETISSVLDAIEGLGLEDEDTDEAIAAARREIRDAIRRLETEREERNEDHSEDWQYMNAGRRPPAEAAPVPAVAAHRSVFADVDGADISS